MAMATPFLTEQPVAAREIARHCELSEEARQLLRDEPKADIYVGMLLQRNLDQDALRFLAYRLPKREAVWWGALCAWKGLRPDPPEADAAALHAAVLWVRDGSEANRRAAEAVGHAAGPATAAGCVALAAFWSGGSMAPEGLPDVAPAPFLTARSIDAAVSLAVAQAGIGEQAGLRRFFIQLARDVSSGRNRWF